MAELAIARLLGNPFRGTILYPWAEDEIVIQRVALSVGSTFEFLDQGLSNPESRIFLDMQHALHEETRGSATRLSSVSFDSIRLDIVARHRNVAGICVTWVVTDVVFIDLDQCIDATLKEACDGNEG